MAESHIGLHVTGHWLSLSPEAVVLDQTGTSLKPVRLLQPTCCGQGAFHPPVRGWPGPTSENLKWD
jgi:hypothetical protein